MQPSETVLVAGATGMLGEKIALALLNREGLKVSVLARKGPHSKPDEAKRRLEKLEARGATIVHGDLLDPASLEEATKGVSRVISAVQGDRNVIVTGQLNLLRAAERAGVQRFVPSDFSGNLLRLDPGDNYNMDLRREFDEILMKSPVEHTLIFNGGFTEIVFSPWGSMFNFQTRTFSYWGDGEAVLNLTTVPDTALYTAEAIFDPAMANGVLQVAGDVLTIKQLLATYQEVTGQEFLEKQLGSVEELKRRIEQIKATASSLYEYLPLQYNYLTVSGKSALETLDNYRYPQVKPVTVREYLERKEHSFEQ